MEKSLWSPKGIDILPYGSDILKKYSLDESYSNVVPPYPMFGPNNMLNISEVPGFTTICPFVKSIPEYLNALSPFQTS